MLTKRVEPILIILTLSVGSTVALAESVDIQSHSSPIPSQSQFFAQRRGGDRQGAEREAEKLMEQLNLSDTQVQQLNAVRSKYHPQIQQLRQQMKTTGQAFRQMMDGTASASALRTKHQDMMNLRQTMANLRFESMLEMREILTPEQRKEFVQLMQQNRRNRGNQDEWTP